MIRVDDTDTGTIELTRGEVRKVIAGLARTQAEASGDRDRRIRNLRDRLAAEFDFDEYRDDEDHDHGWLDFDDWLSIGDDDHDEEDVEFSRGEAKDVVLSLSRLERDLDPDEYETVRGVQERFEDEFDIDADADDVLYDETDEEYDPDEEYETGYGEEYESENEGDERTL